MNPTAVLFGFLAMASSAESLRLFDFIRGRSSGIKNSRVLAAGHDRNGFPLVPETVPNTPLPTGRLTNNPSYHDARNEVASIGTDDVVFTQRKSFSAKTKPVCKTAGKLRDILKSQIPQGYSDLSIESAKELLKITSHMKTVVDKSERFEFLSKEAEKIKKASGSDQIVHEIMNFHDEIGYDLQEAKTVKDFLKILIKFYEKISEKAALNDCIKAILRSNVFDVNELPKVFNVTMSEIFHYACANDIRPVALNIAKEQMIEKDDLISGCSAASEKRNEILLKDLITLIGDH